jgi:dihydroneopterin aldolase
VKDTINYAEVTDLVLEEITTNPVSLIEKLAGRIAEKIIVTFAQAGRVTVTVHKPHAPVKAEIKDISVTISR